jgi:type VI protein secretion system component VasK
MVARKKASTGLGAEYEDLILSEASRRERSALAFRAARFGYRLASWILSLALTFIAFIAAFGIAAPFMNDGLALLVAVIVLGLLVWMWRRSWRRYRAPLVRLVPAPDYQQFVTREEPVERRGRLKLDLRILKRAEPGD